LVRLFEPGIRAIDLGVCEAYESTRAFLPTTYVNVAPGFLAGDAAISDEWETAYVGIILGT
jgi:hypothetical protein